MVFMMEKALIIIVFMYATSFALIGAQYTIADVFGITLTDFNGHPLQSELIPITNSAKINLNTSNSTSTAPSIINNQTIANASNVVNAAWSFILMLSGLEIFSMIGMFGVPQVFTIPFVVLYIFFLIRAMIGLLKEFI